MFVMKTILIGYWKMHEFIFFWNNGSRTSVTSDTSANAMDKIKLEDVVWPVLAFWINTSVDNDVFEWNEAEQTWDETKVDDKSTTKFWKASDLSLTPEMIISYDKISANLKDHAHAVIGDGQVKAGDYIWDNEEGMWCQYTNIKGCTYLCTKALSKTDLAGIMMDALGFMSQYNGRTRWDCVRMALEHSQLFENKDDS